MPNHRQICPYCKTDVLNSIIGSHILRKHGSELFADTQNLKALHSDMNFRKPLLLHVTAEDSFYFCMADSSCIKKEPLADKHFKGRAEAHRQAILVLREKYPREGPKVDADQTSDAPIVSAPLLDQKEKEAIQEMIMMVFAQGDIGFTRRVKSGFAKLGILTEEKGLKDLYPAHVHWREEEEEEEAAVVEEPIVEEVVPEEPPAPIPEPIQETPVLPTPPPVTQSTMTLPGMTVEQTKKFLEMFPPDSKDFQNVFKSVNSGKFVGPPAEVAALMYKSASLQRQPEPTFGNLVQNTKLKKAQRVQKPLES